MSRRTWRGFTLAELLVVFLILSVLVLTLCPPLSWGYARSAARRTTCQSNLKQLASAAAMYAGDYDGAYPQAGLQCADPAQPDGSPGCPTGALIRGSNRFGYSETWQGGGTRALLPYARNPGVTWCPHGADIAPTPTDPKSYYAAFEWLKRPARVRYPETKVLLLEAYSYHDREDVKRHDEPGNPRRRVNAAFVDGHVKPMDLSTGCSGSTDPACIGWESCMGPGGNGNYLCSGAGEGAKARDFP